MIDWNELRAGIAEREKSLVSIIMCVHDAMDVTEACLQSLFRHESGEKFELIIVDNGSDVLTEQRLRTWALQQSRITLLHNQKNLNFALGNNVGFAASRGSRVVFLNNDTEVSPEWLLSLLRPLRLPGVMGVQPKLLYPNGTIQSIGTVFSQYSPMGYHIYRGKPGDYAPTQAPGRFRAITAACMGLMAEDFVRVEGFDCTYINGQEDVDLCLRLGGGEPVFAYAPDSLLIHHEGSTAGRRDNIERNRKIFFERWKNATLFDDASHYRDHAIAVSNYRPDRASWADAGYAVWSPSQVGLENEPQPWCHQLPADTNIAIKIACHDSISKHYWGDYHYATALAGAFLRKGVRARIDVFPNWYADRQDGDINLVLRGRERYELNRDDTNLLWIISHPDKTTKEEISGYDHVFIASQIWNPDDENDEICFDRLLQATDICRFFPTEYRPENRVQNLFVANSRNVERTVVKDAVSQNITLQIYGRHWSELAPSDWVIAPNIDNVDLAGYYTSADVVLNDHWDTMKAAGFVANRIFDVLACGGNLVTDEVVGMPKELAGFCTFFGENLSLSDALTRAKRTDTPEKRKASAEYIRRNHSFDQRAGTILRALKKCIEDSRDGKAGTSAFAAVDTDLQLEKCGQTVVRQQGKSIDHE